VALAAHAVTASAGRPVAAELRLAECACGETEPGCRDCDQAADPSAVIAGGEAGGAHCGHVLVGVAVPAPAHVQAMFSPRVDERQDGEVFVASPRDL
jgi:hypothetical protein